MGKVVIQSGFLARRLVSFPDDIGIRPSSSRVRKVLFDWLRFQLNGTTCLDLFSGSGILGFEAASHGCQSITSVDQEPRACHNIQQHINQFKLNQMEVLQQSIPFNIQHQYDLILMDPPYNQRDKIGHLMQWVLKKNALKSGGTLFLESDQLFEIVDGWELIKSKKVSSVWMHLFKVKE